MSSADAHGISLFLLGLVGTGHCLGMCGPLVIALPGAYGRWSAHWIYHAGRVTTYVVVGALVGAVGGWMVQLGEVGGTPAIVWTDRIKAGLSALAALGLYGLAAIRLRLLREPLWMANLSPEKIPGYNRVLGKSLNRRNQAWLYLIGLMLGLLPCGQSYAVFAQALSTHKATAGGWSALMFGLGTLPGLLALGGGIGVLWRRYRTQAEIASGLLMLYMAIKLTIKVVRSFSGS